MPMSDLELAHGLAFADLYRLNGLARLDGFFQTALGEADAALAERFAAARVDPDALEAKAESALLIALAPHLEDFIAALFGIRAEVSALAARHHALAPLYTVKRLFVQRRAAKAVKPEAAEGLDGEALEHELVALVGGPLTELA